MKVLIDTHIAIWAVLNDPKLPKQAKDIILDKANDIFYSTASVWEITIKYMLHPDKLRMNGNHNDPFDRIMVAQAKAENFMFLTHDSLIPYYDEPFIILV